MHVNVYILPQLITDARQCVYAASTYSEMFVLALSSPKRLCLYTISISIYNQPANGTLTK